MYTSNNYFAMRSEQPSRIFRLIYYAPTRSNYGPSRFTNEFETQIILFLRSHTFRATVSRNRHGKQKKRERLFNSIANKCRVGGFWHTPMYIYSIYIYIYVK